MDLELLQKQMLFQGMSEEELKEALSALHAREQQFRKGALIFHAGSITRHMGIVLAGSVTIESNDIWGNRTILSHVGRGQVFAESYALLENAPMLVDVTANEDCRILFLNLGNLSLFQKPSTSWVIKIMNNLLGITAGKNLHLTGRSFHTAPKTVRGRILAYLNSVSLQSGSCEFDIPFDRQQLADYLNLDRTALSKELGKMQREGYFSVRKNHFVVSENKSLQDML